MSAITMTDASFVQHREPFRFYLRLTHSLLSDPRANVFNVQGTTAFSNATVGYCDIITTPMDPGIVWHNLTGRVKYVRKLNGRPPFFDESAVVADIRTVFANFRAQNAPGTACHAAAVTFLRVVDDAMNARQGTLVAEAASAAFMRAEAASTTGSAPLQLASVAGSEPYQFFLQLVSQLLLHPRSYGFHVPMGEMWTERAMPGYFHTTKNPMDLGAVRVNLLRTAKYIRKEGDCVFFDEAAVVDDIRLVFANSIACDRPDSVLHVVAVGFLQLVDETVAARRHVFDPYHGDSQSRRNDGAMVTSAEGSSNAPMTKIPHPACIEGGADQEVREKGE